SLERSTSGLGIGLSLVKKMIEMHDGTVEVFSEGAGHGTEFVLTLPLSADGGHSKTDHEDDSSGLAAKAKRRVLVVDDNADSAESLKLLLEIAGHEVFTAQDGIEAVEKAGAMRPEVILLDIGLPRLNGYEAAREIRQREWGKAMTLIAMTGWGQKEDRDRSKAAGFDLHMVKPVNHMELLKFLDDPGL
ncbi:MAG: response regulator, partial [Acidobacteriota bacterium]